MFLKQGGIESPITLELHVWSIYTPKKIAGTKIEAGEYMYQRQCCRKILCSLDTSPRRQLCSECVSILGGSVCKDGIMS
jgi:hypothetical protein